MFIQLQSWPTPEMFVKGGGSGPPPAVTLDLIIPYVPGVTHADATITYASTTGNTGVNLIAPVKTCSDSAITTIGGNFWILSPYINSISLPALTHITQDLQIDVDNNQPNTVVPTMTSLSLPALTNVRNILVGQNYGSNYPTLASMSFPALVSATGDVTIMSNALTTLNLGGSAGVCTISSISFSGSGALANLTVAASFKCAAIDISGNQLSLTSVNNLLVALVTGRLANGSIDISGGSNASPSGAGAAAVVTLTANGWSVTTN